MKTSLAIGAAFLLLGCGAAAAQSRGYGAPAQDENSKAAPSQEEGRGEQGTSPREAWRQYMMKRRAMEQGEGRQHGADERHGGNRGMVRMGVGSQGARFMFDREHGRIFIQCAPSDSTEACARAVVPMIEAVMGPAPSKEDDDD